MAPGRLTRSQGETSIPMVQSTVQSMKTPPETNPPAQSSSSVKAQATDTLTSTSGNYIEHS